jgi:hypothetical protein
MVCLVGALQHSIKKANDSDSIGKLLAAYRQRFANEIGLSPKTFARLTRFARAIDLKRNTQESCLNISHRVDISIRCA